MAPTPTGAMHVVPLDDVFFSTTDARGVIDEANEVFRRNARHTRDELIGVPHNLIRHPDMPGAVFKVMWDMLEAGSPVCAYVLNLAGDGSAYWAFATVVPIGDRYLSVRTNPCNLEARDLVHSLYQAVRAAEQQARADGAGAREAAVVGVEVLSRALVDNGFGSYADFQADLVPVEVAARAALRPSRPKAADARLVVRVLLADVRELRSRLEGFSDHLGSLTEALFAILAADITADVAASQAFRNEVSGAIERVRGLHAEVAAVWSGGRAAAEPTGPGEPHDTRGALALARRQLELDLDSVQALTGRVASGADSFGATAAGLDRLSLAELLGQIIERSAKV